MTKSMQHVASSVCFQCLAVWEMLSCAQATFPAIAVSAVAGTAASSVVNCPLSTGNAVSLTYYLASSSSRCRWWPDCTKSAFGGGNAFNLFVVCSWMRAMEPRSEPGRQLCEQRGLRNMWEAGRQPWDAVRGNWALSFWTVITQREIISYCLPSEQKGYCHENKWQM